uniref:hypothetical protein n=1 Tax=Ningiella ruwaisensis TaxID=2364274 RepID=UPI00109EF354|nr:hypothetical protein [Ningiella ruwaisensis]
MVGKDRNELDFEDTLQIVGGWSSTWSYIGRAIGSQLAESAYSKNSRDLHSMNREGRLQGFLDSQNDPLL